MAINGKCAVGGDGSFHQVKGIKRTAIEKAVHKKFPVGNLNCDQENYPHSRGNILVPRRVKLLVNYSIFTVKSQENVVNMHKKQFDAGYPLFKMNTLCYGK